MHLSDFVNIKTDRGWMIFNKYPSLLGSLLDDVQKIFQSGLSLHSYAASDNMLAANLSFRVPLRLQSVAQLDYHLVQSHQYMEVGQWGTAIDNSTYHRSAQRAVSQFVCDSTSACDPTSYSKGLRPPPLLGTMCWHAPKPFLLPLFRRHSQHLPVIISSPKMYQVLFE